jgi:hypothetical protein
MIAWGVADLERVRFEDESRFSKSILWLDSTAFDLTADELIEVRQFLFPGPPAPSLINGS